MVYGRRWWTFVMVGSAAFTLFGVLLVVADLNDDASAGRVGFRVLQTLFFAYGAVWAYRRRSAAASTVSE